MLRNLKPQQWSYLGWNGFYVLLVFSSFLKQSVSSQCPAQTLLAPNALSSAFSDFFFSPLSKPGLSFCSGSPVSHCLSFHYLVGFFLPFCHLGCVSFVLVHSSFKGFFVSKLFLLDLAFFFVRKFWLRNPQHPVKDPVRPL